MECASRSQLRQHMFGEGIDERSLMFGATDVVQVELIDPEGSDLLEPVEVHGEVVVADEHGELQSVADRFPERLGDRLVGALEYGTQLIAGFLGVGDEGSRRRYCEEIDKVASDDELVALPVAA